MLYLKWVPGLCGTGWLRNVRFHSSLAKMSFGQLDEQTEVSCTGFRLRKFAEIYGRYRVSKPSQLFDRRYMLGAGQYAIR